MLIDYRNRDSETLTDLCVEDVLRATQSALADPEVERVTITPNRRERRAQQRNQTSKARMRPVKRRPEEATDAD